MFPAVSVLAAAMPDLTVFQYSIVDNIFSMTVATMGAAALFLFLSRSSVDRAYRPALLISGIVVSIACYHYFMIRHSWQDAYALSGDGYVGTGAAFNDFYRYADWILTVPLLMVELVAVLRLEKSKARSLLTRLVIAAGLMIALGYRMFDRGRGVGHRCLRALDLDFNWFDREHCHCWRSSWWTRSPDWAEVTCRSTGVDVVVGFLPRISCDHLCRCCGLVHFTFGDRGDLLCAIGVAFWV